MSDLIVTKRQASIKSLTEAMRKQIKEAPQHWTSSALPNYVKKVRKMSNAQLESELTFVFGDPSKM
jgi:hypothetical protein